MARRSKKNKQSEEQVVDNVDVKENVDQEETGQTDDTGQEEVKEDEPDFKSKFHEMNDKFIRLYSEFDNFRKRTAKEKLDLLSNAKGESMKNMLPILDDFERAIANNDNAADMDALKEGFKLIHHKLLNTLQQSGMKAMATEAGDDFDTDKHEAITQIPAPSDDLKGKVVDVIEKGYVLNEKVIRFAKVVIGS